MQTAYSKDNSNEDEIYFNKQIPPLLEVWSVSKCDPNRFIYSKLHINTFTYFSCINDKNKFPDCALVWCGDGTCVTNGTGYTCRCPQGSWNLLDLPGFACFKPCKLSIRFTKQSRELIDLIGSNYYFLTKSILLTFFFCWNNFINFVHSFLAAYFHYFHLKIIIIIPIFTVTWSFLKPYYRLSWMRLQEQGIQFTGNRLILVSLEETVYHVGVLLYSSKH